MFNVFAKGENTMLYKSNERFNYDSWRYANKGEKLPPLKLDYRIVLHRFLYAYGNAGGDGRELINDINIIASSFGFAPHCNFNRFAVNYGREPVADTYMMNAEYKDEIVTLYEARTYKNANIHFKFNVDFMRILNVTIGRMNNWIKNKAEAKEVFPDIKDDELERMLTMPLGLESKSELARIGMVA